MTLADVFLSRPYVLFGQVPKFLYGAETVSPEDFGDKMYWIINKDIWLC